MRISVISLAMFRPSASRTLLRSLPKPASSPTTFLPRCASSSLAKSPNRQEFGLSREIKPLALSSLRQPTSLIRHASTRLPGTTQRPEKEAQFAAEHLQPEPDIVSTSSSTHPVFGEVAEREKEPDVDMMAGVRHDIVSCTFSTCSATCDFVIH